MKHSKTPQWRAGAGAVLEIGLHQTCHIPPHQTCRRRLGPHEPCTRCSVLFRSSGLTACITKLPILCNRFLTKLWSALHAGTGMVMKQPHENRQMRWKSEAERQAPPLACPLTYQIRNGSGRRSGLFAFAMYKNVCEYKSKEMPLKTTVDSLINTACGFWTPAPSSFYFVLMSFLLLLHCILAVSCLSALMMGSLPPSLLIRRSAPFGPTRRPVVQGSVGAVGLLTPLACSIPHGNVFISGLPSTQTSALLVIFAHRNTTGPLLLSPRVFTPSLGCNTGLLVPSWSDCCC